LEEWIDGVMERWREGFPTNEVTFTHVHPIIQILKPYYKDKI